MVVLDKLTELVELAAQTLENIYIGDLGTKNYHIQQLVLCKKTEIYFSKWKNKNQLSMKLFTDHRRGKMVGRMRGYFLVSTVSLFINGLGGSKK